MDRLRVSAMGVPGWLYCRRWIWLRKPSALFARSDNIPSRQGGSMQQPRRDFLELLLGAASATVLHSQTKSGDMIYRTLGKTGERVSAIGLGGSHIGRPQQEQEAIRIIRSAIDRGINFMDNCWDYANGKCETWMGNGLRDGYRQKIFLMTKFYCFTRIRTPPKITLLPHPTH